MIITPTKPSSVPARALEFISRQGVWVALIVLLIFGAFRYEGFFGAYNLASVVRYNAMFALIALGMAFVIMTGGIDLSVGSVVALSSVIAALLSPTGWILPLVAALLAGTAIGFINGLIITKLHILPFIATLAMLLAARGLALMFAGNQSVSVASEGGFIDIGQGDFLGLPIPGIIMLLAFALGWLMLLHTPFGRHLLALGGNEEASRLMGLPVAKIKLVVYTLSGALAGLTGVILAAQFGAGQPTEGVGWELSAIASVVVGGTLLTGGLGTVSGTLAGAMLLGLIFNVLNFENGKGFISLSVYWQSVIRGFFLMLVVIAQNRSNRKT
jgi:galactofuranose transport system permease protein